MYLSCSTDLSAHQLRVVKVWSRADSDGYYKAGGGHDDHPTEHNIWVVSQDPGIAGKHINKSYMRLTHVKNTRRKCHSHFHAGMAELIGNHLLSQFTYLLGKIFHRS